MKGIYKKITVNTTLNSQKVNAFSLRLETRQGCPFISLLFSCIIEILATTIRQGKEIKASRLERKRRGKAIFICNIIICVENLMELTKSLLNLIDELSKIVE